MQKKNIHSFKSLLIDAMIILFIVLLIIKQTTAVSYNEPKFCSMVRWETDAVTFADNTTIEQQPYNIFINNNNTIYIAAPTPHIIRMSLEGNISQESIVSEHLFYPFSVFVSSSNDLYVYYSYDNHSNDTNHSIKKRSYDGTNVQPRFFFPNFGNWLPCISFYWFNNCPTSINRPDVSGNKNQTNNNSSNSSGQVDNNGNNNQNGNYGGVYKRSLNRTDIETVTNVMNVNGTCFSLFIDINDTIYCSMTDHHQVVKKSLNTNNNTLIIAAGKGLNGSTQDMLSYPCGIFVSIKSELYVADFFNHRIQRFQLGNLNATTVAGETVQETITLSFPTGVILDGNQHLFIVDSGKNRIVRSGPNGFRCVIGCLESSGSAMNQLFNPTSLSFDSYGNMIVVDTGNDRIQKFRLAPNSCYLSYNQPKFCPSASWNPNATTFSNSSTIGHNPHGIFIDTSNNIYVASREFNHVLIGIEGNSIPSRNLSGNLSLPHSIFVTAAGDIYVENGVNSRVEKWTLNGTHSMLILDVDKYCLGLFVDLNNTLYCSIWEYHRVVKRSLNDNANTTAIAAGNGTNGSSSYLLSRPFGIFVDTDFNLYVADTENHRIQRFPPGQLNGTTIVSNNTPNTIKLNYPTGIALDANGYLFIVDCWNHRIVGGGSNGFRCIIGCSNTPSSASNPLNEPITLAFDSYGNIFVTDKYNHRVQKFILMNNSCNQITTTATTTTTTMMTTFAPEISTMNMDETTSSEFFIPTCRVVTPTGISCDKLNSSCHMKTPCQNNGNCTDNNNIPTGYICSCPPYFNGTQCQHDHRLCKSDTCWNNGTCYPNHLNATFECRCADGWHGRHCETKINYCENETCQNNGVCRPLFMNYTCECLGDSYFGRQCEFTATKIKIYKIVSKSFASVAIIVMISAVTFIVIMDILKYCFGIDPVHKERERLRRKKLAKKRKPVIQRFVYVNAPSSTEIPTSTIKETTV